MSSNEEPLVDIVNYNNDNTIYSDIIDKEIKPREGKSSMVIKFKRILVSTRYKDGTVGDLVFRTPNPDHFCFGLQEFDNDNGKTNRSLSFSLYDKNITSRKQIDDKERAEEWAGGVLNLVDHGLSHLNSLVEQDKINDKVGGARISKAEARDYSPLKSKGENAPIFAGKLMERFNGENKDIQVLTIFEDYNTGLEIDPFSLRKVYCKIDAAIKFEAIFMNATILAFQFRLYHVRVNLISSGPKKILPRRIVNNDIEEHDSSEHPLNTTNGDTEQDPPINNSDDDEPPPNSKTVKRKTTKKSKKT